MSQLLTPLDGGSSQIQVSTNYRPRAYLSKQYVSAKKLQPSPTEWIEGGRPIYNRLPAASERYNLHFGLDNDSAYVYIPVGTPSSGPGTLQVVTSGEDKYLVVQGGSVVWEHGDVKLDPVLIDLKLVGLRSTQYLLAYQLYFDDSPTPTPYSVEDYSLSGLELNVESSTDNEIGWRYTSEYAFTNLNDREWRNRDKFFPAYQGDAYFFWQSEFPNSYSNIKLRCPSNVVASGQASLFFQTCPSQNTEEKYCSNPEWVYDSTVEVSIDSQGYFFEFSLPYPHACYGWKVEWSNPDISLKEVLVSGVITLKRRPATGLTYCRLVAYPRNAVPSTVINSNGIEVPAVYCNLAYVDVNDIYGVEKVSDIRQTVGTDYQPIADWLTEPWDHDLINLYTQVKHFPEYWMNPSTCMNQTYTNLEQYLIQVEK